MVCVMHHRYLCPRCSDPVAHPGQFCDRCTTWTERAYGYGVPANWREPRRTSLGSTAPKLPEPTVVPPRIREDLRVGYAPGVIHRIMRAIGLR